MATWNEVEKYITSTFHVTPNAPAGMIGILFPVGDRKQQVFIRHIKNAKIGEWAVVTSPIGKVSAAKLKGSIEYTEKVNKMAERRAHVRTHEPGDLTTNVRWCGCSTEIGAQNCCLCAEYGAPDMKPIPENKWGSKYVTAWTPCAKKRKLRPHDKPCQPNQKYIQVWPRAGEEIYSYVIVNDLYYEINAFPYE
jgi:hypothetical protein